MNSRSSFKDKGDKGGKIMPVDLRESIVANIIRQHFDSIAQGNKGYSTVEELKIEGTVVHFRVQIRHWHIWNAPWPLERTTMYDITTPVQGAFDIANPVTYKDIQACVDVGLGIGRVCASLEEIAIAVAAVLA